MRRIIIFFFLSLFSAYFVFSNEKKSYSILFIDSACSVETSEWHVLEDIITIDDSANILVKQDGKIISIADTDDERLMIEVSRSDGFVFQYFGIMETNIQIDQTI